MNQGLRDGRRYEHCGSRAGSRQPYRPAGRRTPFLRRATMPRNKGLGIVENEQGLIAIALALLGSRTGLSAPEVRVSRRVRPHPSRTLLRKYRKAIRAGADPLGEAFGHIRSPELRRSDGATYTPAAIVRSMVRWAAAYGSPVRVVDAGAGSGRFVVAAATKFPRATLVAIESDPVAALVLRANIAARGLGRRVKVLVKDYRDVSLPAVHGPTLFIGNPPYVRHHEIHAGWKEWYADAAGDFGIRASRLAGLHLHFFVKTMHLARPGDFGAFITSAEWLDVNYGSALRRLLADGLGGVGLHVIDPRAMPFADAATTAAITCFHVGMRPASMLVRSVNDVSRLGALSTGRPVSWAKLEASSKWSLIVRPGRGIPAGYIELGEICRVHRGQVTGSNHVWIAGSHAEALPARVLKPTVTKARELISAEGTLDDAADLRRVIDLPEDLDQLDDEAQEAAKQFLRWAREQGAHESYIAMHRRPWWTVKLRAPAPIICTYMARRPPAFVRNLCAARHLNIAHGLYPRETLSTDVLDRLSAWLTNHIGVESGRTYAGGLTKFEPGELERVHVPRPEHLPA